MSNRTPERQFGIALAAVCGAGALLHLKSAGTLPTGVVILAILAALASWLLPSIFIAPTRVWLRIGNVLHKVVNPVILGLIFLIVVLPVGLMLRSSRKRFSSTNSRERAQDSYWIERSSVASRSTQFHDQF